jgi:hypothetical protein
MPNWSTNDPCVFWIARERQQVQQRLEKQVELAVEEASELKRYWTRSSRRVNALTAQLRQAG